MRSISTTFRNSLEASESGDIALTFLTISHQSLFTPIRVVNDVVDYTWQTFTWTGFPFELAIVSDSDGPPTGRLRVHNVDGVVGRAILTLPSSPILQVEVISDTNFNPPAGGNGTRSAIGSPAAEIVVRNLKLRNAHVDVVGVEGELWTFDLSREPYPIIRTTLERAPALYK